MSLLTQPQSLINVQNARLAERRGFSGRVEEILSELFQNSQRAGATKVEIFSTDATLRIVDDGHGIDGIGGFCKLLCMYESGYGEEIQVNQQPVGVGLYSMFAHEQVSRVTIRSGGLELTIGDMNRWWTDFNYYSQWQQWLQKCETSVGFELDIDCKPEFVQAVQTILSRKSSASAAMLQKLDSPAWGYEGILDVQMNGVEVDTSSPVPGNEATTLLEAVYQGNKLSIFYYEHYSKCPGSVNWYGQLIYCDPELSHFGFCLKVVEGSPVTPIKPTRNTLVEDQKLANLRQFIVDALFEALRQSEQTPMSVGILYSLAQVDANRFIRESPFFLSNAILPYEGTARRELCVKMQACLYAILYQPVLVGSEVRIVDGKSPYDEISEMATFSRGCGVTFHQLVMGDISKLHQQTLYWKPGQPHEIANQRVNEDWFYGRGEWGLGTGDQPPTVWSPVTGDVLLYDDSDGCYPTDIHWLIGCDDPIDCFSRDAWITFDNSDNDNPDAYERDYGISIDAIVRLIMGNAISSHFSQDDLESFAIKQTGLKKVRVQKVEWKNRKGNAAHKIKIVGESSTSSFEIEARLYDSI